MEKDKDAVSIENIHEISDVMESMISSVLSSFRTMLNNYISHEKLEYEEEQLDSIIHNVAVIPIYPILFLSLFTNSNLFMWKYLEQRNMTIREALQATNIPRLIGQFQLWQIEKYKSEINLIDQKLISSAVEETNAFVDVTQILRVN